MKILVLGKSSIFKRRILFAIRKIDAITKIEIASISQKADWGNYAQALEKSQADIVYISLINSLHYKWAKKALDAGMHVIVDKPATSNLKQARQLLSLAKRKKLLLAEAAVYAYHPQIKFLKNLGNPNKININFSFPKFENNNYRYSKKAGGGAIEDLGPYAMSVGRLFFASQPKKVLLEVTDNKNGVPVAFSFFASYPKNKIVIGNCGFNSGYINNAIFIAEDKIVSVDRVFTTPADLENKILVNNKIKKIKASDSFEVFLKVATDSIAKRNWSAFYKDFINDAMALEMLRKAV